MRLMLIYSPNTHPKNIPISTYLHMNNSLILFLLSFHVNRTRYMQVQFLYVIGKPRSPCSAMHKEQLHELIISLCQSYLIMFHDNLNQLMEIKKNNSFFRSLKHHLKLILWIHTYALKYTRPMKFLPLFLISMYHSNIS